MSDGGIRNGDLPSERKNNRQRIRTFRDGFSGVSGGGKVTFDSSFGVPVRRKNLCRGRQNHPRLHTKKRRGTQGNSVARQRAVGVCGQGNPLERG
ncbi:MAG: hypothetical protein LBH74_00675 [Nitrososphaerota archaeon]|nr:hypothetical protein [Nitrososphaerota archaeon]